MSKEQPEAMQLPTLPFTVLDEFGQPCEDRVRDHFAAAFEELRAQIGQGEPVATLTMFDIRSQTGTVDLVGDWKELRVGDPLYTHPAPQQKPLTDEQDRALCEAYCNAASDEYFKARPQLDSSANRRIFYAGHRKAWIEWQAAHNIGEKK